MTYREVLDYMFSQLPMFHRIGKAAYKANLENATVLDEYFQYPHRRFKTIHVAGTNGKGSVSHMLAAVLQKAGYKTGLFTSPHLKDFRERIRVNGQMVGEPEVVDFVMKHKAIFDRVQPSFFEMTSAFAFEHFAQQFVDIAVIEVGLGGRLDSTNIINPILSVITNIGIDHVEYLGDTLDKIAGEKAGIIKPNIPVVVGEFHPETWPVFNAKAQELNSPIVLADKILQAKLYKSHSHKQLLSVFKNGSLVYENISLDLGGFYQQKNICTVLAAVELLQQSGLVISEDSLREAFDKVSITTGLLGRWQTLSEEPLVICDTGHNAHGIAWVVKQIADVPCARLHMVIGMVGDKDVNAVLAMLPKHAKYYFTKAQIPRALAASDLQERALQYGLSGTAFDSVPEALNAAKANAAKADFIFVGGSTFVVAEVV